MGNGFALGRGEGSWHPEDMKNLSRALVAMTMVMTSAVAVGAPEADPVESGLRDAFRLYQAEKFGEVSAKLRELLKLLEEKEADRVGEILPAKIDDWEGDELKREDLALLGGGVSVQRDYFWGVKKVNIKLVKGSPLLKGVLALLENKDVVALSGRKTHTIFGETAVMESDRKLQLVIDGEILVEVTGNEHTSESDVVGLARELDVKELKKMQ
jgi:hypothetical protein